MMHSFSHSEFDLVSFSVVFVIMSSLSRKRPDGNTKRKRAKQVAALIQSQRGDIHKFFKSNTGASINPNDELAIVAVEEEAGASGSYQQEENIDTNIGDSNVSGSENAANSTDPSVDEQPFYTSDIYDPRNWDNLDNKSRDI
jgi:hypothetical protein